MFKKKTPKQTHFFPSGSGGGKKVYLFGSWMASHVKHQEPKVYYHHQKA